MGQPVHYNSCYRSLDCKVEHQILADLRKTWDYFAAYTKIMCQISADYQVRDRYMT